MSPKLAWTPLHVRKDLAGEPISRSGTSPNTLDLVHRAHPTQSQLQALQSDNRALLEILAQHGTLFCNPTGTNFILFELTYAPAIPKSLLRRQTVDLASRTIALRAIACAIMHCSIPTGIPDIISDLKWLRSVRVVGEEAMIHVVDLGITCFHWIYHPTHQSIHRSAAIGDRSNLMDQLDDALLEMVCKHYYANSVYPNQWNTDTLYQYINKIVSLYLDPDWLLPAGSRQSRQGDFMSKARRHLRKCHTHRLASILVNRICGERFPEELIELVRSHLYDDEHISSVVLQNGTVVGGETSLEELDKSSDGLTGS